MHSSKRTAQNAQLKTHSSKRTAQKAQLKTHTSKCTLSDKNFYMLT